MATKSLNTATKLVALNSPEITELIPYSRNTLYKWHSEGKYPAMFVVIGRKVLINLQEWGKITQKAVQKSQKKAEKTKKALGG